MKKLANEDIRAVQAAAGTQAYGWLESSCPVASV